MKKILGIISICLLSACNNSGYEIEVYPCTNEDKVILGVEKNKGCWLRKENEKFFVIMSKNLKCGTKGCVAGYFENKENSWKDSGDYKRVSCEDVSENKASCVIVPETFEFVRNNADELKKYFINPYSFDLGNGKDFLVMDIQNYCFENGKGCDAYNVQKIWNKYIVNSFAVNLYCIKSGDKRVLCKQELLDE